MPDRVDYDDEGMPAAGAPPTAGARRGTDAWYEAVDRTLADFRRRLDRIDGHLGITSIDHAGIPDAGERVARAPSFPINGD